MKKLLVALLLIAVVKNMNAQTDSSWTHGGFVGLNFNQVSLSYWAQGGENSVALSFAGNGFEHYKHGTTTWDNDLQLGYGLLKSNNNPIRKNEDKIVFDSKYGQLAKGKFYYTGLVNFMSQFAKGYDYSLTPTPDATHDYISKLFAPAYLTAALGMEYKPNDHFSLFLSPATGKFTIVADKMLSDIAAYGVDSGMMMRSEYGALLKSKLNTDLTKTLNLQSNMMLFNNYTDKNKSNRKNIDLNFDVTLNAKLGKYFGASFYANALYDNDILLPVSEIINNVPTITSYTRHLQLKEVFGLGFSYKF